MSSAIVQEGRFADAQKSCFQDAKRWNMGSAVQQLGWLADGQESRIQVAKRSEMGRAVLQRVWFGDAQESRIQAAKRSEMAVPTWKDLLRNRVFRLGKVHIWLVPPCNVVNSLMSQELRFQPAKRSVMECAEMQGGLFADCQEWRIQDAKRSDMSSALLREGRYADTQ